MNQTSADHEITRTDRFVLSYQLEGLCIALRLAVEVQQEMDGTILGLLKRARQHFDSIIVRGRVAQDLPDVDGGISLVGALALAETFRMTLLAFLTPEELEDAKQTMGLVPST